MRGNKAETADYGFHGSGDMIIRTRTVIATPRRWFWRASTLIFETFRKTGSLPGDMVQTTLVRVTEGKQRQQEIR